MDKVYDIWKVFRTMTLEEYKELFVRIGIIDIKAVNFSEEIPDIEKTMKKELALEL